ncbi:clostripain-related cysteine peptidase [uncultured Ruminococcus sp.]|uniref:clostripain-related cysteine peptidase n=1 Tax=uncultured Ruminococcus sp. TaxID=165186 RepID=UPI0025F099AD|nr:clostripain-related cysteine peptidase [uncultured Ruminococcus sp.]
MDPNQNRPQGRRKNVTSGGSGAHRRGDGLGTGPVGSGSYSGGSTGGGGGAKRAAAGGGGLITIIIIVFLIMKFMGGGAGLGGAGNGGGSTGGGLGDLLGSLTGGSAPSGFDFSTEDTAVGNDTSDSTVDTSVATGSREKRTVIKGNGEDVVTLMVYMCGTDLESKYGMASSDMEEMRSATFGDNVNVIIFTGGCSQWKVSGISNKVNQIYQIKNGQIGRIVEDAGSKPMTDPNNLASFIQFCAKNFPANRNELILWDHGGGSVTGYGYDEKNKNSGSMSLAGVNQALKAGGVKFDFIGFDACLMATAETALMLNEHADYLIASEETEPGIGWYYTNWLSKLGSNTSAPTLDIGKNIVDDFVTECAKKCRGQKTTLSVIDLAEFSNTVPKDLTAFSKSISEKIAKDDYKDISNARYATREFAESTRIDQVDLVNLAENIGTPEAKALASSLKNAIKYNRTSTNMTNAYGVSIYFPYQRTSYVDKACSTYSQIGMDSEYSKCIKQFAKVETGGQIAAGGTGSVLSSLFGGAASSGSSGSSDMIGSLLTSFLGGGGRSIEGLDASNTEFMEDTDVNDTAQYLSTHYFDSSKLTWEEKNGTYTMKLPESQWEMVHSLDLNMFYDDGEGYIDLGLDNIYYFDDNGNLVADTDKNWLSINGNVVAYYHTDTTKSGNDTIITGYVPAFLNGERVNLIIQFTNDDNGIIAGASTDYVGGETEAVAKNLTEIKAGDTLDFICDYYNYDQEYQDSYLIGEQVIVTDNMTISNTPVGDGKCLLLYRFSDIYNQNYWSEPITIK